MARKSLVLVDGSYYLFRAFHAIRQMTTSGGAPTNAIFGVGNMLRKLIAEHEPDCFAAVFDAKGKTFRDELYPAYKANRPPMPPDLASQVEPVHELIRAYGLPLLMIPGVEADDVIATLAVNAERQGMDTFISSGDKDLCQIVDEHIRMVNPMDGTVLDPPGVMKKYGVRPDQMIDYLALVGDSVDNVPGIPGVGPKTAAKWLEQYGSLDEIVRHREEIKNKAGENLRAHLDRLDLARQLITLRTDVPLDVQPVDLERQHADGAALRKQFERWEFRSWLTMLENGKKVAPTPPAARDVPARSAPPEPPAGAVDAAGHETVLTEARLEHWLAQARKAELLCVDTETTGLDYVSAGIVGLSLAVEPGSAAYIPVGHDYPGVPAQLDAKVVLAKLRPLLEAERPAKLGHNVKFDMSVFASHGITLGGLQHDSMLESYVLDSAGSRHDMDSLAEKHLGVRTIHYEDVAGKGAKQIPFNHVPLDTAGPYAAEDADVTLRLHRHLWPKLAAQPALARLYREMEMPLVPVLSRMECNGVMIDPGMLRRQSAELLRRMAEVEEQAWKAAGQRFNIGSPKQIQAMLYEKMNLPVLERTPKGQPSTAESVLADLAHDYDLPRLILEHRSLSKLRSTYTDALPQQINAKTGRVHTSYHQAVAATGRLSSSDPNLQNIPVRTAEGRRIRQAFVAPEGKVLLSADYSQIELRIMAHLSGDKSLLRAFAENRDIHRLTASEVFDTPLESVSDEQRRAAKAINFGLIYGMSPFGLAKQLGIERGAAKEYVDRYFERYPAVREFMDRTKADAKEKGYVETVFGRRLHLGEINSKNAARRQYAERSAINAPMQGTAADIIKRAMIAVDALLRERFPGTLMIMQVHDELVFEAAEGQAAELRDAVTRAMTAAAELRVPLQVDTGQGRNWDEAH
ncbi:MAG TPA: DNA polymerase I [Gammaproteobacteria bacterium]